MNIGATGKHIQNLFVGDLNLKNERGSYTIVEEEDYLSIKNNKTGKLFKFVLEEVTAGDE